MCTLQKLILQTLAKNYYLISKKYIQILILKVRNLVQKPLENSRALQAGI